MRGRHVVTLKHLAEFPAGDDIGDTTVALNAADNDFGDELAVATDEQFAVLQHAFLVTDVEHDKIPLRINHHNFAPQICGEFNYRRSTY